MKPYFKRMLLLSGILVLVFAAFIVRINFMIRNNGETYAERASTRSASSFSAPGSKGLGKPASASRSVQTFSPPCFERRR